MKLVMNNRIYFVFFLVLFIFFAISFLFQVNLPYVVFSYIKDPSYRDWVTNELNTRGCNVYDVKSLSGCILTWPAFSYDYCLSYSVVYIEILLPVMTGIHSYVFSYHWNREDKMKLYRFNSSGKYFLKHILTDSVKFAISVFSAYLSIMGFIYLFQGGHYAEEPFQMLFVDILGLKMCNEHRILYYLIEGFTRFFIAAFVYSFAFEMLNLIVKEPAKLFVIPIGLYLFLAYFFLYLSLRISPFFVYLQPNTIFSSGKFVSFNSIQAIVFGLLPVMAAPLILFAVKNRKLEL